MSIHPIDTHVGLRIRGRRQVQGMSLEELAAAIDLTYQQVQKYEKGMNRVSASMLHEIAQVLKVPVAFFFDGTETIQVNKDETNLNSLFIGFPGVVELANYFVQLTDPNDRKVLIELAKRLVNR